MGAIYETRVKGKATEELLEELESHPPDSPVFQVVRQAINVRLQEESARVSRRLAVALNWLTLALALATAVGAGATLWAVLAG